MPDRVMHGKDDAVVMISSGSDGLAAKEAVRVALAKLDS